MHTQDISTADRLIAVLMLLLPVVIILNGMAASVFFILLACVIFIRFSGWKRGALFYKPALLMALLATTGALLSAIWSLTPWVSLATAGRGFAMLFITLAVLLTVRHHASLSLWARHYSIGIIAASLLLVLEFLPFGGLLYWSVHWFDMDYDRFFNKNINRGLCALAVLCWPALLVRGRQATYTVFLPLLVVAGIFSQHSLSAKIGVVLATVIFYLTLYSGKQAGRCILMAAILFVWCWPLIFYAGESEFRHHVYALLPESSQHRIEIWHFTMERWLEKPWLGWGVDTARVVPGGLEEVHPGWAAMPLHPHNGPLQVLFEQGIIGYMLLMAVLGWLAMRSMRLIQDRMVYAVVCASWMAYLVIGFSAFSIWQAWWLATGLMVVIINTLFMGRPQKE
jgi:O-antigen ligase